LKTVVHDLPPASFGNTWSVIQMDTTRLKHLFRQKDAWAGYIWWNGGCWFAVLPGEGVAMTRIFAANSVGDSTRTAVLRLCLVALLGVAGLGFSGCRVHVDKDSNGKEKNVQVDTPLGGVHVNTDQTSASDLGLPLYPGASQIKDNENHKSADIHMGFGEWQLRIKAVSYGTSDDREKVTAFYKKALARFGDVITCQGNSPVGTPTATREGLTCDDNSKNSKVNIDSKDFKQNDFQLKAGSKRHQHIVGFEDSKGDQTKFALVAIDLPGNLGKDDDDDKQ
jgi:hypothetical protein